MENQWVFIVHPRDKQDIKVAFGNSVLAKIMMPFLSEFKVLSEERVIGTNGQIVVIPIMPHQMYKVPHKMQELVLKAVLAAQKSGIKVVGLGELTSCFTSGGEWLLKQNNFDGLIITTGNNLTAGVVCEEIKILIQIKREKSIEPLIAIVGATGSVGSAVTQLLHKECELLLIARNMSKLLGLQLQCENVKVSNKVVDAYDSDIIVLLTSSEDNLINLSSVPNGVFIYDITQPSNIDISQLERRPDLFFVKGGLMVSSSDEKIKLNVNLSLPEGKILKKKVM